MVLDRPFMINLYWGGKIEYENGYIKGDESTLTTSIVVRHKMRYDEFIDLVYEHIGVEKTSHKLKISLCYQFCGRSNIALVISDSSLDMIYYLAENDENYWGQVYVEIEKITPPTNVGFMDLLRNWLDPGWKIQEDTSKLSGGRGRKRVNRIHNEMDVRHPDEPRRCGLCHQQGHNRRNCPNSQPRFNHM